MALKKITKKRKVRRAEAPSEPKAEAQTQTEAPVEPKPEAQETAPDFSPELGEVNLNIQTIDEADPTPASEVAEELKSNAPAEIPSQQGLAMHPCGLPLKMCAPQTGRKLLAG